MKAKQNAKPVDQQGRHKHPQRTEDQEQFRHYNKIDNEQAVGHARKHLRPRQRDEKAIALYALHRVKILHLKQRLTESLRQYLLPRII